MADHHDHLHQLVEKLRDDLAKCAEHPEEERVHHVRTGTRRVQAMAETILRESAPQKASPDSGSPDSALRKACAKWLRQLQKIRRAAAPVRDLDVHRTLLAKLTKLGEAAATRKPHSAGPSPAPPAAPDSADTEADSPKSDSAPVSASDEALRILAPAIQKSVLHQQAEHLDAWLKKARDEQAHLLRQQIAKRAPKFEARLKDFESALQALPPSPHRHARPAGLVALEAFARLCDQMPQLDAQNLHDFRKGAKKARYIAESGSEPPSAAVAKTLKKLQDEIGDWHDWMVLAEEARIAFHPAKPASDPTPSAGEGADLIALLDSERNQHFLRALRTANRLRGKLMGEWHAAQTPSRHPSSSAQTPSRPSPATRKATPRPATSAQPKKQVAPAAAPARHPKASTR